MNTEQTPHGEQGVIPGTAARTMPATPLTPTPPQAAVSTLPLFAPDDGDQLPLAGLGPSA